MWGVVSALVWWLPQRAPCADCLVEEVDDEIAA